MGANWPAYINHHRIFGTAIVPSPVYIELVLQAAEKVMGRGTYSVENLTIPEALILPEDDERKIQVIFEARVDGERYLFNITSPDEKGVWKNHATGEVARLDDYLQPVNIPGLQLVAEAQQRCTEQIGGRSITLV